MIIYLLQEDLKHVKDIMKYLDNLIATDCNLNGCKYTLDLSDQSCTYVDSKDEEAGYRVLLGLRSFLERVNGVSWSEVNND